MASRSDNRPRDKRTEWEMQKMWLDSLSPKDMPPKFVSEGRVVHDPQLYLSKLRPRVKRLKRINNKYQNIIRSLMDTQSRYLRLKHGR